jgi:hypothetical protein
MATEHAGFFSDPKVILSLIAIGISLISFIWTLANQFEQNRRWDSLNIAAVELKDVKFKVYRELTRKEAMTMNWGYSPLIYSSPDNWDKYQMIYFLRLRNAGDDSLISNANPAFTVNEVADEIKRLQIRSPVSIYRSFMPIFYFDNQGKTDATECTIEIHMKPDNNPWHKSFTSNTPVRIPPGKVVNVTFEFDIPMQSPMYKHIDFKIKLSFTDLHGNVHTRDVASSWESDKNYWFFGKDSNHKTAP